MAPRTSNTARRSARDISGLEVALHAVGLGSESALARGEGSPFAIVDTGRGVLVVDEKRRVDSTMGRSGVQELIASADRLRQTDPDRIYVPMVAADRLSADGRAALDRFGISWFDRRGHLRIQTSELFIDSDVPAAVDGPRRVTELFTTTGLDVGLCFLLDPDRGWGVSELAAEVGRSKGRVSELLAAMRAHGLVGGKGRAEHPALFWEIADAWTPRWYPLASLPEGDHAFLQSGTLGAAAWGAPVAVSDGYPPELYCEQLAVVKAIVARHRTRGPVDPVVARVAHTPTRLAHAEVATRLPAQPDGVRWALAHPAVVALDLAQDRARGREILEDWSPPEGSARVW